MYINTTPSLSSSYCARHHHLLLLLLVSWWHLPCTLCHRGNGGGHPGSHRCPPPCHPHPPRPCPPHRAGWWWWWWGRPCCRAPRLTHPPCCHPCRCLVIVPLPLIIISSLCPSPLSSSHHRQCVAVTLAMGIVSLSSSCQCREGGGGGVAIPPLIIVIVPLLMSVPLLIATLSSSSSSPSSFRWWWWHVVEG